MRDDADGVAIVGRERSVDGEIGDFVGVPVSRLRRHALIAGTTGSGKTTTATTTVTTAATHLDGASIIIDPKASDWPRRLARAEYYHRSTLDHVYLWDATEQLPAISFFDVRPMLAAGISREQAVATISNQFLHVLDHVMADGLDAVRSPDVLRYLITALFDPVHGNDCFPVQRLADAAYDLRRKRTVPEVSTAWGEELLASLQDGTETMFQGIMQGAATRLEKIFGRGHLRPMFNHSPADPDDAFRFSDWLDRDAMLLFDLGGVHERDQRVLATTLTALLWRAIQQRSVATDPGQDPATAFLVLEELAKLGIADQLVPLLSLGREYGLAVLGMLQYPGQLKTQNPAAYEEILTDVHSLIIGRVNADELLVDRLSSSAMSTAEVTNRLGSVPDDQWLFQPAAARGNRQINTHLIHEAPLPPGHPDGPRPLSPAQQASFPGAFEERRKATRRQHSVLFEDYVAPDEASIDDDGVLSRDTWEALVDTQFRSTLPLIRNALPNGVRFDLDRNGIACVECSGTQPPSFDGLLDAIRCHGDLDGLDRAAVYPVGLDLSLSRSEVLAAPVSPGAVIALQILNNMANHRYDYREFDPVSDAVHDRLAEMGLPRAVRTELEAAGLIRQDRLKGYVFPTVTPAGRRLLNDPHRRKLTWGDGKGDQNESLLHIAITDGLARLIQQEHVQDPSSPVTRVERYYELSAEQAAEYGLDARVRLDTVGLDADDTIRVVGEAELDNNDKAVAPIRDFDQIAAIDPEEAIWAVPTDARGHDAVLQPLADPSEEAVENSEPRIPAYSTSTRIESITGIDTPGLTQIHTLTDLRSLLDEPSPAHSMD